MSSLASVNANSRRSDVREDLAFMSSSLTSVTSITYEQAAQLLKVATPITCPYTDVNGKIIQLWKYHESLVASLLEGEKITLFPGENVCNFLNPSEKGESLLRRLESSSLKKWKFAYLPERSRISVCPFLATGISSRNEVLPDLQTQHQIRQLQIAQDEQAILKRCISENGEKIASNQRHIDDIQRGIIASNARADKAEAERDALRSEQATLRGRITNLEIASADNQRRLDEMQKEMITSRAEREDFRSSIENLAAEQATLRERISENGEKITSLHRRFTRQDEIIEGQQKKISELGQEIIASTAKTENMLEKMEEMAERFEKLQGENTTLAEPKKPVRTDKTLSHEKIAKTIKPLPEIISPKKVKFLDIPAKPPVDLVQGTNWSQILKTIAIFGLTIGLGSYVLRNRKLINSK